MNGSKSYKSEIKKVKSHVNSYWCRNNKVIHIQQLKIMNCWLFGVLIRFLLNSNKSGLYCTVLHFIWWWLYIKSKWQGESVFSLFLLVFGVLRIFMIAFSKQWNQFHVVFVFLQKIPHHRNHLFYSYRYINI